MTNMELMARNLTNLELAREFTKAKVGSPVYKVALAEITRRRAA